MGEEVVEAALVGISDCRATGPQGASTGVLEVAEPGFGGFAAHLEAIHLVGLSTACPSAAIVQPKNGSWLRLKPKTSIALNYLEAQGFSPNR